MVGPRRRCGRRAASPVETWRSAGPTERIAVGRGAGSAHLPPATAVADVEGEKIAQHFGLLGPLSAQEVTTWEPPPAALPAAGHTRLAEATIEPERAGQPNPAGCVPARPRPHAVARRADALPARQ